MDHFRNPRNVGVLENADAIGEVGNPACGDLIKIYLKIDENLIISDCKFQTFGCVAAIASSSMTTEMIRGKTIEETLMISKEMVSEALGGLPPTKIHCSVLAEDAIRATVADYRRRGKAR